MLKLQKVVDFSFVKTLRRHRLWADALCFIAGGVTVAAFAPYHLAPFALIGPSVLFMAWESAPNASRFALRGYFYGLGLFGFGVSWLYNSLSLFGEAIAPLAGPLTALFVAFLALIPALMGWIAWRFMPLPRSLRLLLVWPALWVLFEWLRSWLFTGFPWLLLGDSQVGFAPGALAPLFGTLGVSGFLALLGGLLALAAFERRFLPRMLAVFLIPTLWFVSGALAGIRWTHPDGLPFRVSLIQGNISQQRKFDPQEFTQILQRYQNMTIKHLGSRLIIWPETAVPTLFRYVQSDYLQPLARVLTHHRGDLITGIFREQEGRIYNAVVSMGASSTEFYFKHHLVPFGEYMPLPHWLGRLYRFMHVPMSNLSAGHGGFVIHAAGIPIGVSVCYEVAYETLVRKSLPKAKLLINVSNDAWFGDSSEPYQQLQMARMRALEFGRYMLVAMNTGPSAIIAPNGHIVALGERGKAVALTAEVRPMGGVTPFTRWGEWPMIGTAWLIVLGAAAGVWRRRFNKKTQGV